MPEDERSLTRPSIIVSADAAAGVSQRINYIDGKIHESPEEFVLLLEQIGETATSHTVDYSNRDNSVRNLSRKSESLIGEFFKYRYDLDSEYDQTTEEQIATDTNYQQLISSMKSKTAEHVQTGKMKSEKRPNGEAVPARDLVRRARFGIYLGRVVAEHKEQLQLSRTSPATSQTAAVSIRAIG